MVHQPLVSVIIPAYNAGAYIDDALRSVLSQSYLNLEIIVVDDGSTDNTTERVAAYHPRVHCYQRSNSGGYPGAPRNTGIGNSRGEYLCFLDADDIMVSDRVEKQANFLSDHPEVGVVFTDYRNFSSSGLSDNSHFQSCYRLQEKLGGKQSLVLASRDATANLVQENFGIPSSMMIRRQVLSTVPSFSTEMKIGEDFHFYYRVARQYSVGVVNNVGALRRLHDSNITGNVFRVLHNCVLSRTALRDTEPNAINMRLLNDFLYQCEIDLARAYANRREIRKALRHNLRGMVGFLPTSMDHLITGLWTLVRTVAIALHFKKPGP